MSKPNIRTINSVTAVLDYLPFVEKKDFEHDIQANEIRKLENKIDTLEDILSDLRAELYTQKHHLASSLLGWNGEDKINEAKRTFIKKAYVEDSL